MQDSKSRRLIGEIEEQLTTFAFNGDVWSGVLEQLRVLLGADAALAYMPCATARGWTFEFCEVAIGADPRWDEIYRSFTGFVLAQPVHAAWAMYNPVRPETWQRNRAMLDRDISRRGQPRLSEYYAKMGIPGMEVDQARVLICDGPRLLGWVGVLAQQRFQPRARKTLQRLVPSLRARLAFDNATRDAELAQASLDAALDRIQAPCFLLDASGKILHANDPARLLRENSAEIVAAARRAPEAPDPRFAVNAVVVRGVSRAHLVTLRPAAAARSGSDRLFHFARRWGLTARQAAVLELVVAGLSNKQIGSQLGIAEGTVELHVTALFRKAGVESRAQLVARYFGNE